MLNNKNKDNSNKSATRTDEVEAQIQPGDKLPTDEDEEFEDATPAEQANLLKDELKDKSIPILTSWFDEVTIPTAAGVSGKWLYSGPEPITLFSELELFGGGDIKLSVDAKSNTKKRQDLVVDAWETMKVLDGGTSDDEMDWIVEIIEKYYASSKLLMYLQTLHLLMIQKDSKYVDKDYNGNIFKWLWYETKGSLRGGKPKDGTSNAKYRTKFGELLKGIAFFEIRRVQPSKHKKDLIGRRFDYDAEGQDSGFPDLPVSALNNPEHYQWGPQSSYENGFYYYIGQVGESDQVNYSINTNTADPIDFQDYKDLYE